MTSPPTASKYELALRCPGAFTIPHRRESNAFAEAGTERHAETEVAINAGDIPEVLAERWPGYTWLAEVAFALDIATLDARVLGRGIGRNYGEPRTPFERFGTADALGWGGGRNLVIVDKKGFDLVTEAATNPQLRFLALAASRVYRPERVEVAILHELTGLDVAEVDLFDLDITIPGQLRDVELGIAKARSDKRAGLPVAFNTGRWCRWCDGYHDCPKQKELLALARRDDDDPELALMTTVVDETDAPAVYELYRRIGILHKRIGQSLHAMAASRPIPIGNGRFYGRREKPGNERLDGDVMYEVVRGMLGQEVADSAVTRSASKARLKEAIKRSGAKVAPTERAVLAEVRARGGATRRPTFEFEEFTAELQLVPGDPPDDPPAPEVAAASPF